MPSLENDDRRVGSQGYMMLSESKDLGASDDFMFLTSPKDRDPAQQNQPTEPTFVPIRSWASNVTRRTADVTSSVHYSAVADAVFSAAVPTAISMEVRIEGVMRLAIIPTTILAALYDGAAFSHVTLGFTEIDPFCEGDFVVTNFVASNPIDGAITYSAVLKGFGVIQLAVEPVS